jgi:hypothetical protein
MDLLEALPERFTLALPEHGYMDHGLLILFQFNKKHNVKDLSSQLQLFLTEKEEVIVSSSEKSDKIEKKVIQQLHIIMEKFDLSAWKLSENCQL